MHQSTHVATFFMDFLSIRPSTQPKASAFSPFNFPLVLHYCEHCSFVRVSCTVACLHSVVGFVLVRAITDTHIHTIRAPIGEQNLRKEMGESITLPYEWVLAKSLSLE